MKKLELILAGIAGIALILKLLHIPFVALVLIISFITLAVFYFVKSYYLDKNKNFLNTMNGAALALIIVGSLYFIQHWPFGANLLITGFLGLVIVSLFYIKNAKQNQITLLRNAIFAIFGALIFLFWRKIYVF